MSRDLNKIYVTFPSSILDMIIVCFIYFDNSLFAGLIFGRFAVIFPMSKRFFSLYCSDEKNPNLKLEKILKRKSSFYRVNCV